MKKLLLSLAAAGFLLAPQAQAQLPYNFAPRTGQTYTALTGTTSINGTDIWDEESYSVPLPAGFDFKLGGVPISIFNLDLSMGGFFQDPTSTLLTGFTYGESDLVDRGFLDSLGSRSPISYAVSGTRPNRIFKVELANAGFYDEQDLYLTALDSVNLQIWLYETSSVVEMHYGPSQITHPTDYFYFGNGPLVGYFKEFDGNASGAIYTLTGDPLRPTLDSVDFVNTIVNTLDTWPANGTVYRFSPIASTTAVGSVAFLQDVKVYPTQVNSIINVTYTTTENAEYSITSLAGAMLKKGNLTQGTNSLDVATLAPGTYVLRVCNATGQALFRFTKM